MELLGKSFWLESCLRVGTPAVPFMEQSCVSSDSFIDREFIGCHTSNCIAKVSSHCIVFSQKNSQLTFCWIFVQK